MTTTTMTREMTTTTNAVTSIHFFDGEGHGCCCSRESERERDDPSNLGKILIFYGLDEKKNINILLPIARVRAPRVEMQMIITVH